MRVLAVACLALVACDDGVVIEIRIPTAVHADRVDLFLGKQPCFDGDQPCRGIGPPGSPDPIPGEVFEVDGTEQFFAKVTGDSVEFRLEGDVVLPAVLAVATGPAPGVAILKDIDLRSGPSRYVAELAPAAEGMSTDESPPDDFLLWPPERTPYTCAGVQFHGRTVFVVPEDFDCDQAVAPECNPFVHDASGPQAIPTDKVTCARARTPDGLTEPHCMLGGPPCSEDGTAPLGTCENTRTICTSPIVCSCTDSLGTVDINCVKAKLALMPSTAVRVQCNVAMKIDPQDQGVLIPCGMETQDRDTVSTATDCNVRLAELALPPLLTDVITITSGAHEFRLFPKLVGCDYGLAWEGAMQLPAPGNVIEPFLGVTEIAVDSALGQRSSVIAIEVHFIEDETCPSDGCSLMVADGISDNALSCIDIN